MSSRRIITSTTVSSLFSFSCSMCFSFSCFFFFRFGLVFGLFQFSSVQFGSTQRSVQFGFLWYYLFCHFLLLFLWNCSRPTYRSTGLPTIRCQVRDICSNITSCDECYMFIIVKIVFHYRLPLLPTPILSECAVKSYVIIRWAIWFDPGLDMDINQVDCYCVA